MLKIAMQILRKCLNKQKYEYIYLNLESPLKRSSGKLESLLFSRELDAKVNVLEQIKRKIN